MTQAHPLAAERGRPARPRASLRLAALGLGLGLCGAAPALAGPAAPPETLAETGLYVDPADLSVDPAHLSFTPRYPLWTDGAEKRRWISLPRGTAIDGSDPEAWRFPEGTRIWKEFSFAGQRVETRFLELRADGQWLYAAYAWDAEGREARLVSSRGKRAAYPLGGGRSHAIPSVSDCKACHQGGASEVLGFSAFQLLDDGDGGALRADRRSPGDIDVTILVARGLLVGYRGPTADPGLATSATERSALGYLHGNCGHCHNPIGPLRNLGLFLRQALGGESPALSSAVGQPLHKPAPGQSADATLRIEPGRPERSALLERAGSRSPALQMPPLGTEKVDEAAVARLRRWIAEMAPAPADTSAPEKGHAP